MESIKVYFRNALIGLATMVLSNLQPNNPPNQTSKIINIEEDDDIQSVFHNLELTEELIAKLEDN